MSTKDWKNDEVGTLISEAWGFGFNLNNLNEEKESGGHDCSNHVKENSTGREGRCINHTLTESNDVTHYTVEFDDEIVENIPVSELTELTGVPGGHSHAAKRDDYDHDEKKPRKEYQIQEEEEELEERTKTSSTAQGRDAGGRRVKDDSTGVKNESNLHEALKVLKALKNIIKKL